MSEVHGGIRHLEIYPSQQAQFYASSWRHTPFRKLEDKTTSCDFCSWRHTPFRNYRTALWVAATGSWRHTPFRKNPIHTSK